MTKEEIIEALDKQMAYDHGATDSGVNDPERTGRVVEYIQSHDEPHIDEALTEFLRGYLTPPYAWEDVFSTVRWLEEQGIEP